MACMVEFSMLLRMNGVVNVIDPSNTTSVWGSHENTIRRQSRLLAVVLLALVTGQVATAAAYLFAFGLWNKDPDGQILSLFGVGFTIPLFALAFIIPTLIAKAGISKARGDFDQLLGVCLARPAMSSALVLGAGMFNLFAFYREHNKWSLVPVAVGVFIILMMIPTPIRVTNWLDEVRRTPAE